MEELRQIFDVSKEKMLSIARYLETQMDLGLEGKPSDCQMLPSYVTRLATGMQSLGTVRAAAALSARSDRIAPSRGLTVPRKRDWLRPRHRPRWQQLARREVPLPGPRNHHLRK